MPENTTSHQLITEIAAHLRIIIEDNLNTVLFRNKALSKDAAYAAAGAVEGIMKSHMPCESMQSDGTYICNDIDRFKIDGLAELAAIGLGYRPHMGEKPFVG
jgi:hypothetical protein